MTCTQRTHDCDIRPAASAVKASVWKQFGFCEVEGKQDLDQSHTTCKMCQTKLKDRFTCFQPEEEDKQPDVAAANQTTVEQTEKDPHAVNRTADER